MTSRMYRVISFILLFVLVLNGWLATPRPARAAAITVTTFNDENGTSINTSACSLREAIISANTNTSFGGCVSGSGPGDVIVLGAGKYNLTIPGSDEDDARSGDLDIYENVTISGAGANLTEIFGKMNDRVFHIIPRPNTGITVNISGMRIIDGNASSGLNKKGGGIFNDNNGTLYLRNVDLYRNTAGTGGGGGGGLSNSTSGKVFIQASTFDANTASYGGGIYNLGYLEIKNSLFFGNYAHDVGGAIDHLNGSMVITNSTITSQSIGSTVGSGSAIAGSAGQIQLVHVTITKNNNVPAIHLETTAALSFKNSIITGNTNGNCNLKGTTPTITSFGFNLEGGTNTCKFINTGDRNQVTEKIIVETLANNGGPTKTFSLANLEYETNPARKVVPIHLCLPNDQRFYGRGGATCDIGAFEEGGVQMGVFLPLVIR